MTTRYPLSALIRGDNFIDGQWVPSASGTRFAVTDPATGKTIADVADSDANDARAAT
ncbi:succinate-semialdehyde dehydrogenase (NADP(+)), partial [Paraburkholderia sp. BR14262]